MSFIMNPNFSKAINEAGRIALLETATIIANEISLSQMVPKDTGMLEASIFQKQFEAGVTIEYPGPYARRLYFHPEFNFRKDKNRLAQGRWMDEYTQVGSEKYNHLISVFKDIFYRELKARGVLR